MKAPNNHKSFFLYLLTTCMLWSCDRKELSVHEELYTGTVLLSLDWQGATPTHPTERVHVWGTHSSSGSQQKISLDTLFLMAAGASARLPLLEAEYNIAVWHDAANISFDGTHFHLSTDKDGHLNEPDAFHACFDKLQVTAGQENNSAIRLYPYTRVLALSLHMDTQAEGRIETIRATLNGLASARKLSDRSTNSKKSGSCCWELKRETASDTRSAQEVTFASKRRLLGIHTEEAQQLTLTLHYTNGEQESIQQDLTSALQAFNTSEEETKIFTLSASIHFAGQATPSATIENWKQGTETDLDAWNQTEKAIIN